MENTLENKAKFFAQYWGQKVVSWSNIIEIKLKSNILINELEESDALELTPLSDITDEDAIKVAKIENNYENALIRGKVIIQTFLEYSDCSHSMKNSDQLLELIDFLRSKSYALPWMGLTVEKLIEYGWVKLKKINK